MSERFIVNTDRYNDTLNSVMKKAELSEKCRSLLKEKNCLFERNMEAQEALLKLDALLSDYYKEVLRIMYVEVPEEIIKIFCSDPNPAG